MILLRIHRILFWWYYRLVDDHFKQYTIIKSIKLLRQHYEHEVYCHNGTRKVLQTASKEVQEYKTKYHDLKMQTLANPGTIGQLNKMFGTDFTQQTDN